MNEVSQNKIKAVVFDWDGVIVDSMHMIAEVIRSVASSYGVKVSATEVLNNYFQPKEAYYANIGVDTLDLSELNRRHAAADEKYLFNANPPLFNDVLPTLEGLFANNAVLGIVSGRPQSNTLQEIWARGLKKYFAAEMVLGGESGKAVNLALMTEKSGIASEHVVYIDDLPSGITASRKAGVKSAAIARHESGKARLKALNPDYFLDSLADLLRII